MIINKICAVKNEEKHSNAERKMDPFIELMS
jgi:hypothetical protein